MWTDDGSGARSPRGVSCSNSGGCRVRAPRLQVALILGSALLAFARSGAAEPKTTTNSLGMTLVVIPAGEFTMGSEQKPANWDERPRHRVTLSAAWQISATEVTAEQF